MPRKYEAYFALYNKSAARFISEEFLVRAPTEAKLPVTCVFKDVTSYDFKSDIYLVCRMYRRGALVEKPKKKKAASKPTIEFRRPLGVGVFQITKPMLVDLISSAQLKKQAIIVYCQVQNIDNLYHNLLSGMRILV